MSFGTSPDLNPCKIAGDPDLTGPGVRLATMIPVGEVVLFSLAWTYYRNRGNARLERQLATSICHLNALQLTTAIVFLSIAYSKPESDWFHTLFVLHIAAVSIWSTLLAGTAIPGWFTKKVFQIPALFACFVLSGFEIQRLNRQVAAALKQECFTKTPYVIPPIMMWLGFVVLGSYLALIAFFNKDLTSEPGQRWIWCNIATWKSPVVFVLQSVSFAGIAIGYYATFYAYNERKHILEGSEDEWTPGQVMPLCMIIIGSVADLWNIFDLDVVLSGMFGGWLIRGKDAVTSVRCPLRKILIRSQTQTQSEKETYSFNV